jgi:hypothetical protein
MNASPQQGLYPLSQKAVITLSALDFLFATCCDKASQHRIGRQTNSRPRDKSIGGSSSFERLKTGCLKKRGGQMPTCDTQRTCSAHLKRRS